MTQALKVLRVVPKFGCILCSSEGLLKNAVGFLGFTSGLMNQNFQVQNLYF